MRWNGRESSNVDDARGGGFGGGKLVGGGLGALVIGLIVYLLGGDPSQVLQQADVPQQKTTQQTQAEDVLLSHTKQVLAYTEDVWDSIFTARGMTYSKPGLEVFDYATESACGQAGSASGPFYCPLDRKVYMDLCFFKEMDERFHVPGDFPLAYVIAHEVGHHVQNLLGTSEKVHDYMQHSGKAEANKASVKLELQADFYAGVWAYHANRMYHILDPGDIEEALNAAAAVGDDRLQKESKGYLVPDAFTHGTSAQRMYWFKKGFETGDITQGNTFGKDEDL
ncbi:MAG: neutral zinc metallopeptidase [Bacteroidetes bacterium]|nr:neutral zinc metallopeptidase [Bacteroidota bacterium]